MIAACLTAMAGLAASQERFRKLPPPPEPLPPLPLQAIQTATLANGLRISLVPWTTVPLMSLQLVLDAGEIRSPQSLPGLATCAAHMFLRGTRLRSGAEIEEIIESMGGSLSLDVTQDHVFITFQFLEDALDRVLSLIGELLLQPNFSDRELALVKLNLTYDLMDKEKNPEFSARRHLLRVIYQGHPYANFAFPRDIIRNWNLRDLVAFFDRYYRPNNAQLVLVGNIGLDSATRRISRRLYVWPQRDIPPLPSVAPRVQDHDRICFIDVPGAKDCAVVIGMLFPPLEVPERFTMTVLNQILGGSTSGRLFMRLREIKGYAYQAFSEINHFRAGALFLAQALITPAVLAATVVEMTAILRAPIKEPITADEIEQAKAVVIGSFPLRLARLEDFVARVGLIKAVDWGPEAWEKYYDQTWLVGTQRVAETAGRRLLSPFVIIIAGDKTACSERLAEFEVVEYFDAKGQFQYTASRDRKEP